MQNVLLVLSPFNSRVLSGQAAVDLALELKKTGARRVDITASAQFAGATHRQHGVQSLERSAGNLRELMNSVIGTAEIYDLSSRLSQTDDIRKLTKHCFWQAAGMYARINPYDEQDLNTILQAALQTIRYHRVVFSYLSNATVQALYAIGHNVRGLNTHTHGRPILLEPLRLKIADWNRDYARRPQQLLN